MTTIAINTHSVKEGLTISLGFREFRNGCVRFTPTSVFSPSEFSIEALIEKIRRALGGAINLAAEAVFQPKVKDAKPFIVVSRDDKKELELELAAPDSMLDRLEECVTVLLEKFAGVVSSAMARRARNMEILKLKISGMSPLMMHSDRLANPLAPETKAHKELTAKRKKTEDDHLAIARSEFLAGLYHSPRDGVFIPGQNFDATFLAGAKLQKLGTAWKRGAVVMTDRAKLIYDGPKDPAKMWEDTQFVDCRGVKVGTAKVMRYRPVFAEWATELELSFNPDVLDEQEVKKAISDAGALIGVCEYRPRFGRFMVQYG